MNAPFRPVPSATFPDRFNIEGPVEVTGAMPLYQAQDQCRILNAAYNQGAAAAVVKEVGVNALMDVLAIEVLEWTVDKEECRKELTRLIEEQ